MPVTKTFGLSHTAVHALPAWCWDCSEMFFDFHSLILDGRTSQRRIHLWLHPTLFNVWEMSSVFMCSNLAIRLQSLLYLDAPPTLISRNKIIQLSKASTSLMTAVYPNSWLFKATFSSTLILMQNIWQHCPKRLWVGGPWCQKELALHFSSDVCRSWMLAHLPNFSKLWSPRRAVNVSVTLYLLQRVVSMMWARCTGQCLGPGRQPGALLCW